MKIRNRYIKPETKLIHIDQEYQLLAGSDGTGINENPHEEVVDPDQQLSKPSGPFGSSMWGD